MTSILSQFNFKGSQQKAAIEDNPAIVVTAGAGSGKTRSLVGRYLGLLENGYPIRALIAITFTDKAAREMRTRIRAEVEKWLADFALTPTLSHREREPVWQDISSGLDAARIGTIHSLCAEILRAHPAEAGIDPHFRMLEEGLAAALKAQAIDLTLVWAANDAQSAELFGIFQEGTLRRVLSNILDRRLDIIPQDEIQAPIDGWSQAVRAWLSSHLSAPVWETSLEDLSRIQAQQPDDKLELSRQEVLATWVEVSKAVDEQNWDIAFVRLAQLRKAVSTGGSKGNWDPVDLETARDAMRSLRTFYDAELKPLIGGTAPKVSWALDQQVAQALPALHQLTHQLFQAYQHLKDEQQALDFDDLEGKAAQLLTENAIVRARWQRGIQAVLVDEFQDTNDRQRQIVYALSGFDPQSEKSDPIRLSDSKSVALFIVGDAKQSIYKFRGADVTVFRQVQSDIAAAGGLPIDLDLTFRTHKPLLTLLNTLLAPILGESDDRARPYEVPFTPLRAYRQAPQSEAIHPPYVEFILGLGEAAAGGRAAAAQALADRLHQIHAQEDFEWSDIALLFRASTAFEIYEDALEAAGIPFVTVAGRGFYDRPEIRDLLNALAAIADPSDDLALAGLLRSPAIGLSDADLYRLRYPQEDGGQPTSLWESLQATDISTDIEGIMARSLNIITDLYALVGRAPAAQVLKRYLDLTGYRTMLGMASGGSRLQRNVDKLLADAYRSRMVQLEDFLDYVQTLRDVGTREGEAPVEAEGAVQLMTVHKAKGLEFPLVVIADAAYQPPSWGSSILMDEELGLLLGLRDIDGNRPVTWKVGGLAEAARDEAEDKRLLYVAATRAKEKLLINGHVKRLKAGNLSLSGWLGRLGEVIGLNEVKLTSEVADSQELDLNLPDDVGAIVCSLHPLSPIIPGMHSTSVSIEREESFTSHALPDLTAPLQVPEERLLDEKIIAKESDPPQRVWRIVPRAKRPAGPAWVVGILVHEAIRHWRFPDDEFNAFITPFALEAGLTDQAEIRATIRTTEGLLQRFRTHPLWSEIESAERYHEVPYALASDQGIIDLLYRTDTGWVIVDFKTDDLRSNAEVAATIQREDYDKQILRYADAAAAQLGAPPKLLLVFLQVGSDKISLVEINT